MATECQIEEKCSGSEVCLKNSDETHTNAPDRLLNEMVADYSRYFAIDTSLEIALFEESLEETLMHLEEFCGILDLLRQENVSCLEKHLPVVVAKSFEMQELYDSIDRLFDTLGVIRKCVDDMEQQVLKAEQIFANTKIKKFFTSFWNNKRKQVDSRKPKYVEPNIFSVKELMHCRDCESFSDTETSSQQQTNE